MDFGVHNGKPEQAISAYNTVHEALVGKHGEPSAVEDDSWYVIYGSAVERFISNPFLFITIQALVADNLAKIHVHYDYFAGSQLVLDGLFTEFRGSRISVFSVIKGKSSILVRCCGSVSGSVKANRW